MDGLIAILVTTALLVVIPIVLYNRLVRLRQMIKEAWADVETELRRRHDLIPNLLETVKGYAAHERRVMEEVTRARQEALAALESPRGQALQETGLTRALKSLLAVAESYPDLKASRSFLQLQEELANTEDRIQASRRLYNANVRENNVAVQSFPGSLIAGMFGFTNGDFFEIEDASVREAVRVTVG